jgi:Ala-tRNA(Pro) deacylase
MSSTGGEDTQAAEARLMAYLAELNIVTDTVRHPPVFTVAELHEHCGHIEGAHAKNLFLKDAKGELYLVSARDNAAVDLKALPSRIGSARLSFGKAELLHEVLGVTPGSVTPFALMNDTAGRVRFVLDRALAAAERANFHPLHNAATTGIAGSELVRFAAATGHQPVLASFES